MRRHVVILVALEQHPVQQVGSRIDLDVDRRALLGIECVGAHVDRLTVSIASDWVSLSLSRPLDVVIDENGDI